MKFKNCTGFAGRWDALLAGSLAHASNGCLQLYCPTIWVFMFYNCNLIPVDQDWRTRAPLVHFHMIRPFLIMQVS